MLSAAQAMTKTGTQAPSQQAPIITTLYDLIAALNEDVEVGEENVVTAAVVHLCHSGRLRFLDDPRDIEIDCT
ncbi:MAG: hypothetical protein O7G88_14850 [bacterium]|nr:hypothetical protein [bacterium]